MRIIFTAVSSRSIPKPRSSFCNTLAPIRKGGKNPGQMRYFFALAGAQATAKYYDQAIDTLEFAARITPEHTVKANRLLADLYVDRKMYRQAAACYQKIIQSSDLPAVEDYFRLGYTYFQTGEFLSASVVFKKIRQIAPSNVKAPLYLGHIAVKNAKQKQHADITLKQ